MEVKNRLSDEKLNIGLDRCRFVLPSVAIDGGIYRMNIEKGEKAQILDIATGEVIGVSDFNLTIKGIALKGDDYRMKLSLEKYNGVQFVLDVNIPKLLYNTNERNANNLQHLSQVNQIIEKLLGEVGVHTDMKQARLSSVEINVNSTNEKLYDAMKIIRKGFNTSNDKVFIVESKNNIESLMVKNSYLKVKVYDKAQQLQDTGQICESENLVRVEVSTKHKDAINKITNYNPSIDGVIENWDKLEKWFRDTLNKYIKKPCDEYHQAVIDDMVEMFKRGGKSRDVLLMFSVNDELTDLELYRLAVKKYYKETGKKSPNSVIKNTMNRYEKVHTETYKRLSGNIDALNELWEQVGL